MIDQAMAPVPVELIGSGAHFNPAEFGVERLLRRHLQEQLGQAAESLEAENGRTKGSDH